MANPFGPADELPPPPTVRPSWTTWIWLLLAVAVAALTVVGLWHAGRPYMF